MTTLIGWALLVWLGYNVGRLLMSHGPTRNPVLARLTVDSDDQDTAAEAREGEFARQLVAGRIDSATYRRGLSQLARASATSAGEHWTTGDDGHPGIHAETPR